MKGKWILVAEDDEKDADFTLRALKMGVPAAEAEVVLTQDGSETLDCLYHRNRFESMDDDPPAFILLDLKMPKVNGIEVLRRIKSDSKLRNIPVIMFTSSREEADLARCYQTGANAYVVKPLDFKEFSATLNFVRTFWLGVNEPPPELPHRHVAR